MRLTRREAEDALELPNVQAFLRVIRQGESSQADDAYRMRYHPTRRTYFEDLTRHPRLFETTPDGRRSSAAGAYQITATTWSDIAPQLGLTDFSRRSQDIAAVALMARRGALEDVLAGRIEDAIAKCRQEWTSLPGAAENRAGWTLAAALDLYRLRAGEFMASAPMTQPAAPIEDRSVVAEHSEEKPMAPLLIPLLGALAQSLISIFTPLAQEKISAAVTKATKAGDRTVGDQVAKVVLETAQKAVAPLLPAGAASAPVSEANVVEIVAAAKANAEALKAAEEAAISYLDAIAPLVEKMAAMEQATWGAEEASRNAAAARFSTVASGDDMAKPLIRAAIAVLGALLAFVFFVAGWQTVTAKAPSTEVWAAITGLIGFITGTVTTIYGYRFGSSRQSSAQQVLISELTRRR